MPRRILSCIAAAAALALAAPHADAKTLRWSSQGDYLPADPMAQNELLTNSINGHVYESLVERGKKLEILPSLAASWKQTSPTVWVFSLRSAEGRFRVGFEDAGSVKWSDELPAGTNWLCSVGCTYDFPISTPVMNTSAPPSPTCRAAENVGVSMYRCRTQVMTPSSTRTTTIAIPRANGKSLIRNGRVWPMPPRVVMAPQIRPRTQGWPRPVRLPSSDNASAKPMLMPAPSDAAMPTRNASQLFLVARAAANTGAKVETEPSISPARRRQNWSAAAGSSVGIRIAGA